jgi:hypothetical protein
MIGSAQDGRLMSVDPNAEKDEWRAPAASQFFEPVPTKMLTSEMHRRVEGTTFQADLVGTLEVHLYCSQRRHKPCSTTNITSS